MTRQLPETFTAQNPLRSPFHRVQTQSRKIHICGLSAGIQTGQDRTDAGEPLRIDAFGLVSLVKVPQPFVPERPDHAVV